MQGTGSRQGFVFTGRHMVAIMVAFFGTIITVNLTMAWFASSSWSGLVVQNTYVASQQFNGKAEEARKRSATGIHGTLTIRGETVRYDVLDKAGRPLAADSVTLRFKRPVGEHHDFALTLSPVGAGHFEASHAVPEGQWIVEASAMSGGTLVIHEARRIVTPEGQP